MKLIEMRCPNCDAPLSVNADRDEAFCHHCNTMFLIEDAPKPESQSRLDVAEDSEDTQPEPEETPDEATVEFERAKSELPETKHFTGAIAAVPRVGTDARPTHDVHQPGKKAKAEVPGRAAGAGEAIAPVKSSDSKSVKRPVAVAVVLLIAIVASAATCSMQGSTSSASSSAHEASSRTSTSGASGAAVSSSSAVSPASKTSGATSTSASTTLELSGSASSMEESSGSATSTVESSGIASSSSASTPARKDGFPCNLDSTATFSGVTIPIDSRWKDNSPVWDWRHKTYSNTAGSAKMEDVQISISTFIGGDTKDAFAFMKEYADFGPIFLEAGEYKVKSRDVRDGITYTRVEGVDSHYVSSFEVNPPTMHDAIRKQHAGDVVRCVCLVGCAEDGKGFAVAVSLRGSADNDNCLYSANKILDGVTFVPAECDIDSDDLWLYEATH